MAMGPRFCLTFVTLALGLLAISHVADGACTIYGICNWHTSGPLKGRLQDDSGCFNEIEAQPAESATHAAKLEEWCGHRADSLNCCTEAQLDNVITNFAVVADLLGGCGACFESFRLIFCNYQCSPNQADFVDVVDTLEGSIGTTVNATIFRMNEDLVFNLFDQCKDVKSVGSNVFQGFFQATSGQSLFNKVLRTSDEGGVSPTLITPQYGVTNGTNVFYDETPIIPCSVAGSLRCSPADCPALNSTLDQSTGTPPDHSFTFPGDVGVFAWIFLAVVAIFIVLVGARIKGQGSSGAASQLSRVESAESMSYEANVASHKRSPLQRFYYGLGVAVARRPFIVILIGILFTVGAGSGLLFWELETDPIKLWVPSDSEVLSQKETFDTQFGPFFRPAQLIISSKSGADLFTPEILLRIRDLNDTISTLTATHDGVEYSYDDLCYRPIPNTGNCLRLSPLEWFVAQDEDKQMTEGITEQIIKQVVSVCGTLPITDECRGEEGLLTEANLVLGGYTDDDITGARAIIMNFLLTNSKDEEAVERAEAWEKEFIKLALNHPLGDDIRVSFNTERSIGDEIERESDADIDIIIISYAVMFIYISLALGRLSPFDCAQSTKFFLGFSAIVIVACELIIANGICSYAGLKATLIISAVIPFILLAIGVDNIFIISFTFQGFSKDKSIEERMGLTLAEAGTSVTLAALCEAFTFFLGALTRMPAVAAFSIYAGTAIIVDFIMLVTVFAAVLALDARRTEAGRMDVFCCVTVSKGDGSVPEEDETVEGKGDALPANSTNAQAASLGLVDPLPANPSQTHKFIANYYGPTVLRPIVKAFVLGVFLLFFAVMLLESHKLQMGLDPRLPVPRDSYLIDYFDDLEEYLQTGPPVYFVVSSKERNTAGQFLSDFAYAENRALACGKAKQIAGCEDSSVTNILKQETNRPASSFIVNAPFSWIDDYLTWLDSEFCCRRKTDGTVCFNEDEDPDCARCLGVKTIGADFQLPTESEFDEFLPLFKESSFGDRCAVSSVPYGDGIKLEGDRVTYSRFWTYHNVLKTQQDFIDALKASRDISSRIEKETGLDVFAYSLFYVYFEQYLYIEDTAALGIYLALGAIFLMSLAIVRNLWMSFLITANVGMIVVELLGVMHLWGIDLNAISVVNVLVAIGISVEFLIHIAVAAIRSSGSSDQRVYSALVEVGAPVWRGFESGVFGVIVLAFAESEIFVVFYFRMYISIFILAIAHGIIFLPVLLSLVLPNEKYADDEALGSGSSTEKHIGGSSDAERASGDIHLSTL